MSFIQETVQCTNCKLYHNIALGTFGYGWPNKCRFCGVDTVFKQIQSGWHADNDGSWKETSLRDDFK